MSPLRMRGYERREALYRLLLLTLPRAFRHEFAEEILDAFRDGYREHHTRFGYAAARRFARRSALHVFGCAVRLRMPRRPVAFASSPRSSQWLINVWRDGLIGLRAFAQKPGFFVMAAGTIGLGIGAVTTVFSVVDKVLLRPLPYPEPERIVYFENSSHSLPEFHDWRDRTDSFESLVAVRVVDYDWRAVDEPRRLRTALVTSGFFTLFGAGTVLGQPLVGPAVPGAVPVVLSHAMWQLHWGASPDVIGAQMTINGTPTTVTGVMDPRFQVPEIMVGKSIDVWMPLDESDVLYQDRGTHLLEVAGRLEPSVTLEAAQAQLALVAETQAAEHGDRYRNDDGSVRVQTIVPMFDAVTASVSDTLSLLMGAVGLMLLVACANVANLLLARANDRHREIVVRVALGAGRQRIVGQVLVEAIVLALAGGVLGFALAVLGVRAFTHLSPIDVPRIDTVTVDGRILVFALVTSIATGLVFGVLPALHSARSDAGEVLKDGFSRTTSSRTGRRVRDALVTAEIAVSLILTAGAAVLFHSLLAAQRTDPGIDAKGVLTVPLALNSMNPDERLRFSRQVTEQLRTHPVTTSVAGGVTVPFGMVGGGRCCWFMYFSRPEAPAQTELTVVHPVTTGYFRTFGATITRGRDFVEDDVTTSPLPTIVNTTLARQLFGADDPIGRPLQIGERPLTVVGVVADIRHWGLQKSVGNNAYFPYDATGQFFFRYELALRTDAPLEPASAVIRSAIRSVDPNVPVESIVPLEQHIAESIADSRFYTILFAVFAATALALAAAGVYSSMLYSVGQRYRELGVRLAVGARPSDITRLVLLRGAVITVAGVLVGLMGTVALVGTIEHLIVGVSTLDVRTLSAAVGVLVVVALAACWFPAHRASGTDPNQVLRFE